MAGILWFESYWADGLGTAMQKVLGECSTGGFLNVGCVLRDGSFEAWPMKRRVRVEVSPPETSLVFFFLWLLDRLQKMGTAPAIDLRKYGARVGREK